MGACSSKIHAISAPLPPLPWATTENTLSGSAAFLAKERVQCMCEGGGRCTKEDPALQKSPSPFAGLHANWVTGQVLAMARPWQCNVEQHCIPEQFRAADIGMVLNLQEVGEHAHCGKGNVAASGFSYDPQSFMLAGIGVYNLSWRDMGVPSLHRILEIVQVMAHVTNVEGRKIAVHCHAGLGRTGLAIACFLVFQGACSGPEAVVLVRQGRPGALQTRQQVRFVEVFEHYLRHLRCVFRASDSARQPSAASRGGCGLGQPAPKGAQSVKAPGRQSTEQVRLGSRLNPGNSHERTAGQPPSAPDQLPTPDKAGASCGVASAAQAVPSVDQQRPLASTTRDADATGAGSSGGTAPAAVPATSVDSEAMNQFGRAEAHPAAAPSEAEILGAEASGGNQLHSADLELSGAAGPSDERADSFFSSVFRLRSSSVVGVMSKTAARQQAGEELAPEASYDSASLWTETGRLAPQGGSPLHASRSRHSAVPLFQPSPPATLEEAMQRQRRLLHGEERRHFWQVPKVLALLTAALQQHPVPEVAAAAAVVLQPHVEDHNRDALQEACSFAQAIVCQVNDEDYSGLEAAGPAVLLQLLRLWLQQFHPALLAGWASAGHIDGQPGQEHSGSRDAVAQPVQHLSELQLQLLRSLVSSLRPFMVVDNDMQGLEGRVHPEQAPTAQPVQSPAMTAQGVSETAVQSTNLKAHLRTDQPLLQWLASTLLGADSPLSQLAAFQQVLLDSVQTPAAVST